LPPARFQQTPFKPCDIDGIDLRILAHNHEHMGQSIVYTRMIGVKPPWSE
jgi:hypothetical protein